MIHYPQSSQYSGIQIGMKDFVASVLHKISEPEKVQLNGPEKYTSKIRECLVQHGNQSIAEISAKTGIHKTTVFNNIDDIHGVTRVKRGSTFYYTLKNQ